MPTPRQTSASEVMATTLAGVLLYNIGLMMITPIIITPTLIIINIIAGMLLLALVLAISRKQSLIANTSVIVILALGTVGFVLATFQTVQVSDKAQRLLENSVMTTNQSLRLKHPPKGATLSLSERLDNYPTKVLSKPSELATTLSAKTPQLFVFYKVGCPYCEAAHATIDSEINKTNEKNVHYVNVESTVGKLLTQQMGVTKPTTLVVYDPRSKRVTQRQMFKLKSDGVRENTPDKTGIQELFNLL